MRQAQGLVTRVPSCLFLQNAEHQRPIDGMDVGLSVFFSCLQMCGKALGPYICSFLPKTKKARCTAGYLIPGLLLVLR